MDLEKRSTIGNNTIKLAIMEMNDQFNFILKTTKVIINATIPIPTFKP